MRKVVGVCGEKYYGIMHREEWGAAEKSLIAFPERC